MILSRLPSDIACAVENPAVICEGWGSELVDALDDPKCRDFVVRTARALTQMKPRRPADDIYRRLISASRSEKPTPKSCREFRVIYKMLKI